MTKKSKEVELDIAIAQIEKAFGDGAIMLLSSRETQPVKVISTGSITLDHALGVGGVPVGRITEIYGPEAAGKTTLALSIVAQAQKQGKMAAYVDVEHSLDPVYAKKIGVEPDMLLISQPDTGEQALDIVEMLVRSGAVGVIVVDSVAALVPRAEIEGDMGDQHIGRQARLMSQAMRKLTAVVNNSGVCLIFTNQIRMKIGVMFGNPETTPGGRALKFYSTIRMDIRRIGAIKVGEENIGNRTKVKVAKNKVAAPFRIGEFDIVFGEGISREGELLDLGIEAGLVEKHGAWFSYQGLQIGQGREKAKNYFKSNSDIADILESAIRNVMGMHGSETNTK